MGSHRILSAAIAVVLLALLVSSSSFSTIPISGELSMIFSPPLSPGEEWSLEIRAVSMQAFQDGKIVVSLYPRYSSEHSEDVVWTGKGMALDTIIAEHTIPAQPPGDYMLGASLIPIRGGEEGTNVIAQDIVYISVTDSIIRISRAGFSEIRGQEIREELRARGLDNATDEELHELAPDLAERIENLNRTVSAVPRSSGTDSTRNLPAKQIRADSTGIKTPD